MIITGICAGLSGVIAGVSGYGLYRMRRNIRRFHKRKTHSVPTMFNDLPSVSVCIPVRNEEHAMTRCLEEVLASSYPKMEVLVCDDDSRDDTPSLIKMFARDGVRFIEAPQLATGWLGKNAALQTLLDASSGSYVIFLDVDTRIQPDTIGQLVAYAQATRAEMVSALPIRSRHMRMSTVLAPLRYFWKMLLHTPQRPIAASNLWLLDRKRFIERYHSLVQWRVSVEPEVAIAAELAARGRYRFLLSYRLLGISYDKTLSSQIETGVRLRFPALNFSYLKTILVSVALWLYLAIPFVVFFSGGVWWAWLAGAVAYIMTAWLYATYLAIVWQRGFLLGALLYPFAILLDSGITIRSAWSYTRNTVTWKGRRLSECFDEEL